MPRGDLGERAAAVKARLLDPLALTAALGLVVRREGRAATFACLWHDETEPSCRLRVHPNDGLLALRCFGCGVNGDALTLIARVRGLATTGPDFVCVIEIAEAIAGTLPSTPTFAPRRTTATKRPAPELFTLWQSCRPVTACPAVQTWLESRGLDPVTIEERDLVRAVPAHAELPWWAGHDGRSWAETGHLCIIPTFNAAGMLGGLRARCVTASGDPKELAAIGGGSGCFADTLARRVLEGGGWPVAFAHRPPLIVVAEGVPDFLTWAAMLASDADEDAPAIFGLYAGAWTPAIARRIPDGARVVLRLHADAAGTKYAEQVRTSLGSRCAVMNGAGGER
jgi:hypothetical protein